MSNTSSTKALTPRQSLAVGITLFSMFFGAGNLILPPLLGLQAGTDSIGATIGFLIAGIGLPVLGIVAVALVGTARELANRAHPLFSSIFVAAIYLAIGPCLAIPRTSSTSFEMLVPLLPEGISVEVVRLVFSIVFFVVAYTLAMRPGALTKLLGRITGPALIVLLVLVIGSAILSPAGITQDPIAPYNESAAVQGFLTGYQTMDLLAALVFGLVIAENIKGLGITDPAGLTREISKAGVIAGILMAVIYCGLAFVGTNLGSVMPGATNGAAILTASATLHFGLAGTIIIAAIFLLACLNVCIGLISCCGTYFAETFGAASPNPEQHMLGKLGYPVWAAAFAIFSCFISNFGLDAILTFSVPLLSALYPVSIVLMIMGLAHNVCDKLPLVWPWVTGVTTVVSVLIAVRDAFLPDVALIMDALPLANVDLAWLVPAVCAAVIGCALSAIKQKKSA